MFNMKFFEHITDEYDCLESYRFLGITLMEKATVVYSRPRPETNRPIKKIYKRFLGRTIYKAKYYNWNGLFKREISILSIPILGTLKLNGYKLYLVLGIKVYSKPMKFLTDFKTECVDNLDKKHDDIYIILGHLGDAFRMLTLIKSIIKEKRSKNPLIMVFDDSFEDLIKMMHIDIPYVHIKTSKPFKVRLEKQLSTDVFLLGNFKFFLLWNRWLWATKFYTHRGLPADTHVIDVHAAYYHVVYDNHKMGKLYTLPDAEENMLKLSKQAELNLDKFVFIAPEAFSYTVCPIEFWQKLIKIFQDSGYDVFINSVTKKIAGNKHSYMNAKSRLFDIDSMKSAKSFFLTVPEAYALAKRAKKIVSQRSGLSDMLIQTDAELCILYSIAGSWDKTEHIIKIESVLRSPYANPNKINEINIIGMSQEDIIKSVIESLKI